MKRSIGFVLALVVAYVMSSCGAVATSAPTNEASDVMDQSALLSALKAAGVTPAIGDPISQDFFSVQGTFINLDQNESFQVFEYKTVEDMEADAAKVAPDGGSIGTSMVNWIMPPHFFKSGRIIILYIGENETTLSLLEKVMGKQFAGQ
jgi:hypothetical protein